MATSFTVFPQLITELRLEIWRLALPAPVSNGLYPWRKGCWVPKHLTADDQGFEPDGDNLYMRFDPSLLEPLRVDLPLYLVNREARDVALEYVHKQKLTKARNGSQYEFERAFDRLTDTVLLPAADMVAFEDEPLNRTQQPDLIDRIVDFPNPALLRLAVLITELDPLLEFHMANFESTGLIETVYAISASSDAHDPLDYEDDPYARISWTGSGSSPEFCVESGDEAALEEIYRQVKVLDPDCLHMVAYYDFELRFVRSYRSKESAGFR